MSDRVVDAFVPGLQIGRLVYAVLSGAAPWVVALLAGLTTFSFIFTLARLVNRP